MQLERDRTRRSDDAPHHLPGHGALLLVRIQGKPQACCSYNNNPLHYFRQIMWGLRKLRNACQGQRIIKPLMCRRASDEAQMVFTNASSSHAEPQPARTAQDKPNQPKAVKSTTQRRIITPKPTVPQPTTQVPLSEAEKLAQDYCWHSFRGVCSFVIGWFRN
uniref:Fibroblast growth factor binding protein 2a n=1 Tax=Sinocyclocheilus grahami TaxID=75366 RepID=A0A672TB75_SINGR